MVNVRTKGQSGEREACKLLNGIIASVVSENDEFTPADVELSKNMVQRNQNQSAVGGNDLINTMGLSFEVKRQEALSIGKWWAQCCDAANRNGEHPVLMYRQNGKKWKFMTNAFLPKQNSLMPITMLPVTLELPHFVEWFTAWVRDYFEDGGKIRS